VPLCVSKVAYPDKITFDRHDKLPDFLDEVVSLAPLIIKTTGLQLSPQRNIKATLQRNKSTSEAAKQLLI
jgi:hypothetical protein